MVAIWAFLRPVTKSKDVRSGLVGGKTLLFSVVVVLSVVTVVEVSCVLRGMLQPVVADAHVSG